MFHFLLKDAGVLSVGKRPIFNGFSFENDSKGAASYNCEAGGCKRKIIIQYDGEGLFEI